MTDALVTCGCGFRGDVSEAPDGVCPRCGASLGFDTEPQDTGEIEVVTEDEDG